jgi:hypothetical protein
MCAERTTYCCSTGSIIITIMFNTFVPLRHLELLTALSLWLFCVNMVNTRTSGLKNAFAMKAAPVAFLQFVQWQAMYVKGSPVISYLIALQRQDPVCIAAICCGWGITFIEPSNR